MSSRPTVATSSRSLNAWTGPASAEAAAAGGRRPTVVELEFLAFPVLPLRTMMRLIDQEAKTRPYMRAASRLRRSYIQLRPIGKKGDRPPTTIDPPLPPSMREASSVIFILFCFLTDKRNKISTDEKFLHRDS